MGVWVGFRPKSLVFYSLLGSGRSRVQPDPPDLKKKKSAYIPKWKFEKRATCTPPLMAGIIKTLCPNIQLKSFSKKIKPLKFMSINIILPVIKSSEIHSPFLIFIRKYFYLGFQKKKKKKGNKLVTFFLGETRPLAWEYIKK